MGNGTSYSATIANVPNPHDVDQFVRFKFIAELYVVSHFTQGQIYDFLQKEFSKLY